MLAFLLLSAASALACSVPVFRYALEHWEADPFQAIVYHRGALTAEQQKQITALKPPADAAESANLSVTTVDVAAEMSPDHAEIWKQQPQDSELPHVVLRYPRSTGVREDILTTPLARAAALNLTDSPVRQEILQRLGEGQSAVWVLLESGDAALDDGAAKLLQDRLDYLMGVLTLPELDNQDIANGLVSVGQDELRLEFSLVRVSRKDAKESALISTLMGSEKDLSEWTKEPMVFPVFGRGRALYALIGKGIRAETIEEAATFLIGKCSCQVKEQNPGIDLLFTADWKKLAKGSPLLDRELPDLTELAKTSEPVTVRTSPEGTVVSMTIPIPPWVMMGGMALVLMAAGFLWKKR
ncbi:hypothetical protein BGE01nite_05570 [Brevifollis gellanilyticus]|uniref:Uncharacterized protein n=2 Tax=Brevifollis gellanilyticus TaxID=748831 RepID=A0A512M3E8_9BACT|nr:hypothetical protein BGE01nite_05570 [Brevifollis gellanilyticus]